MRALLTIGAVWIACGFVLGMAVGRRLKAIRREQTRRASVVARYRRSGAA